jgi:MFS family permease
MTFRSSHPLPAKVRAIAAGRAISFLGDEVALLAMLFKGKAELGHFGIAAVLIAGTVPLLALSPVAGLLVDRVRTRPLVLVVSLVQAGLCVALAYATAVTLVPLVALLACGTAIASPAWQALIPELVDDEGLPAAMGLVQSASAAAGIAGPFLGGLLVGTLGFHTPLLLDAATFVVLGLVPVVLRVDRQPTATAREVSRTEMFAGFSLILRDPLLRALVMLAVFFVLTLGVVNVVELLFVTGALHAGPIGYGLLGMSAAAGMLVVGASSGPINRRFTRPGRLFVAGCAGLCLTIGAFALTDQLWQAACVVFVTGASNALVNVSAMVLLTRRSSPEIRGRVFSALQGTVSAAQIGAMAAGGLLVFWFAPRSIMLVGAALAVLAVAALVRPVLRAEAAEAETAETVAAETGSAEVATVVDDAPVAHAPVADAPVAHEPAAAASIDDATALGPPLGPAPVAA